MSLVRKAMAFAMEAHEGQERRKSLLPYVTHPISVYGIVKKYKESKNIEEILAAAILHDVMEDCGVSRTELEEKFGPMVTGLVEELTNNEEEKEKLGKEEYIKQKLLVLSNYALVIKLADILDNASDNPTEFMLKRVRNTMVFLASKRSLTQTQGKIFNEIYSLLKEYEQ